MIAAVRAVAWVVIDGPPGALASGDVRVGPFTARRRVERTLGGGTRVVDELVVPATGRVRAWLAARRVRGPMLRALHDATAGRAVRQPGQVRTWTLGEASLAHADDPFG